MGQSIDSLMESVGCHRWPERWRQVYDKAMSAYDREGCPFAEPAYYDKLASQYHILTEELETYKKAAEEIRTQEDLAQFLMLLCTALQDEADIKADLDAFTEPHSTEDAPSLGLDMLTGLAICSQMPRCYEILKERNYPENIIHDVMVMPEKTVKLYRQRHNGIAGFNLLGWYQRAIFGKLFRIGRLEIQIPATYQGAAWVFENELGQHVILAHDCQLHTSGFVLGARRYEDAQGSWVANVEETPDTWHGYAYDEWGYVQKDPVHLDKKNWKKIFAKGDPVVALHIPADGRLDPEAVDESLAQIREFLQTYFPDYPRHAFTCNSWLVNPKLVELLGEESNISKFCRRFQPVARKLDGKDVFNFVFLQPDGEAELKNLPEDTRLRKVLKEYYLSGGIIHEMTGFFI